MYELMTFNAAAALSSSDFSQRVQLSNEQDRLDIVDKVRTSVLPWRGQFSPQLVEFLIEKYSPKRGLVADPFCGSGTVLYEAAAHGLDAFARDINPAAVCLAKVATVCALNMEERVALLDEIVKLSCCLLKCSEDKNGELDVISASTILQNFVDDSALSPEVFEAFLLLAFGNNHTLKPRSVERALSFFKTSILSTPCSKSSMSIDIGDSRQLNLNNNSVDYLVTSPPYINVFNYHQNYRPIVEALGYHPLPMARAELGANRKFRQNRYLTAIQYCMDMAQFLIEAARILKPDMKMTVVLGRESNVRRVPLRNGELIAAIASEGIGGKIIDWHERNYLNRFGEKIYEDVLTIQPTTIDEQKAIEVGRLVGTEALRRALDYCPHERTSEIEAAIEYSPKVEYSPFVLKDVTKND